MVKGRVIALIALVSCTPRTSSLRPTETRNCQGGGAYRAMVYSETFGARYALPKGGIVTLDPGLQAVVIRVVQQPSDHPDCYLDLYLDDSLGLAFPEGTEGRLGQSDETNPLFFMNEHAPVIPEDTRWQRQLGSFHAVACHQGPETCTVKEESGPVAFARHLAPGTALQTYAFMCSALDPAVGPTEMWLLRNGQSAADLQVTSKNEGATYRFRMPIPLFQLAGPRIQQARQYFQNQPVEPEPPRGQYVVPGGS